MYMNVHGSINHDNKKVKATQIPIKGWMGKQNMVHLYNGILFSHEKEWSADACCNMDEPQKHYAEWKKPDWKGQVLYDSTHMNYPE